MGKGKSKASKIDKSEIKSYLNKVCMTQDDIRDMIKDYQTYESAFDEDDSPYVRYAEAPIERIAATLKKNGKLLPIGYKVSDYLAYSVAADRDTMKQAFADEPEYKDFYLNNISTMIEYAKKIESQNLYVRVPFGDQLAFMSSDKRVRLEDIYPIKEMWLLYHYGDTETAKQALSYLFRNNYNSTLGLVNLSKTNGTHSDYAKRSPRIHNEIAFKLSLRDKGDMPEIIDYLQTQCFKGSFNKTDFVAKVALFNPECEIDSSAEMRELYESAFKLRPNMSWDDIFERANRTFYHAQKRYNDIKGKNAIEEDFLTRFIPAIDRLSRIYDNDCMDILYDRPIYNGGEHTGYHINDCVNDGVGRIQKRIEANKVKEPFKFDGVEDRIGIENKMETVPILKLTDGYNTVSVPPLLQGFFYTALNVNNEDALNNLHYKRDGSLYYDIGADIDGMQIKIPSIFVRQAICYLPHNQAVRLAHEIVEALDNIYLTNKDIPRFQVDPKEFEISNTGKELLEKITGGTYSGEFDLTEDGLGDTFFSRSFAEYYINAFDEKPGYYDPQELEYDSGSFSFMGECIQYASSHTPEELKHYISNAEKCIKKDVYFAVLGNKQMDSEDIKQVIKTHLGVLKKTSHNYPDSRRQFFDIMDVTDRGWADSEAGFTHISRDIYSALIYLYDNDRPLLNKLIPEVEMEVKGGSYVDECHRFECMSNNLGEDFADRPEMAEYMKRAYPLLTASKEKYWDTYKDTMRDITKGVAEKDRSYLLDTEAIRVYDAHQFIPKDVLFYRYICEDGEAFKAFEDKFDKGRWFRLSSDPIWDYLDGKKDLFSAACFLGVFEEDKEVSERAIQFLKSFNNIPSKGQITVKTAYTDMLFEKRYPAIKLSDKEDLTTYSLPDSEDYSEMEEIEFETQKTIMAIFKNYGIKNITAVLPGTIRNEELEKIPDGIAKDLLQDVISSAYEDIDYKVRYKYEIDQEVLKTLSKEQKRVLYHDFNVGDANNIQTAKTDIMHTIFTAVRPEYNKELAEYIMLKMPEILKSRDKQRSVSKIQANWTEIQKMMQLDKRNLDKDRNVSLTKVINFTKASTYPDLQMLDRDKYDDFLTYCAIGEYSTNNVLALKDIYDKQLEREASSIPNVSGKYQGYTYQMLPLHDPAALFFGDFLDCCQLLNGAGESCMEHSCTSDNGRVFIVRDEQNKIIAGSWVWRNGQTVCFDNIEAIEEDNSGKNVVSRVLLGCYKLAAKDLIEKTKDELIKNKPFGVQQVTVGYGYSDVVVNTLPKAAKAPFPIEEVNYTHDSRTQYILAEDTGKEKTNIPKSELKKLVFYKDEEDTPFLMQFAKTGDCDIDYDEEEEFEEREEETIYDENINPIKRGHNRALISSEVSFNALVDALKDKAERGVGDSLNLGIGEPPSKTDISFLQELKEIQDGNRDESLVIVSPKRPRSYQAIRQSYAVIVDNQTGKVKEYSKATILERAGGIHRYDIQTAYIGKFSNEKGFKALANAKDFNKVKKNPLEIKHLFSNPKGAYAPMVQKDFDTLSGIEQFVLITTGLISGPDKEGTIITKINHKDESVIALLSAKTGKVIDDSNYQIKSCYQSNVVAVNYKDYTECFNKVMCRTPSENSGLISVPAFDESLVINIDKELDKPLIDYVEQDFDFYKDDLEIENTPAYNEDVAEAGIVKAVETTLADKENEQEDYEEELI